MDDAEGGTPACYLSEVDELGRIVDVRDRIRLAADGEAREATGFWISEKAQDPEQFTAVPVLAARPSETAQAYAIRLETPECRTAAWGLALRSLDEPIVLAFPDSVSQEVREILLEYVRGLVE
jgi:hypothetical protein